MYRIKQLIVTALFSLLFAGALSGCGAIVSVDAPTTDIPIEPDESEATEGPMEDV